MLDIRCASVGLCTLYHLKGDRRTKCWHIKSIHTGLSNLKKTLNEFFVFCLQNRAFWQSLHDREDLQADGAVLFTLKKQVCVVESADRSNGSHGAAKSQHRT